MLVDSRSARPARLEWVLSCAFVGLLLGGSFEATSRPPGWSEATHGRTAIPDYARVFAQDRVNRLEIRVTAADWQALVADMQDMAGPFGQGGGGFGGLGPDRPPGGFGFSAEATTACTDKIEGSACSYGAPPVTGRCVQIANVGGLACFPVAQGEPGGQVRASNRDEVDLLPRTPIYVPATLVFDGVRFEKAGFRLKGNSSLLNSWRQGSGKLPFRLNMDALETRFSEIRDQTFFGFPNLSFNNNAMDSSYLRGKVATDLFRDAGVPAARTAFTRVYLDRGAGSVYLGVYTMTEVPDGPMLDAVFGSDSGNLYKPHGTGGRWTVFIAESFPKKTNVEDEDWTDIENAIAALNAWRQEPQAWRARLEARFDVDGFLRWLALNTILGNTDAYGGLSAHNYYVYGSPRHRDGLFWIPWDHDLAMNAGGFGGGGGGGGGGGNPPGPPGGGGAPPFPGGGGPPGTDTTAAIDLFHDRINSSWPLIRFLMDDRVYRAAYRSHVEELLATVFEPSSLTARLRAEYARIAEYVAAEDPAMTSVTPAQVAAAVEALVAYVPARSAAVQQVLGGGQ